MGKTGVQFRIIKQSAGKIMKNRHGLFQIHKSKIGTNKLCNFGFELVENWKTEIFFQRSRDGSCSMLIGKSKETFF